MAQPKLILTTSAAEAMQRIRDDFPISTRFFLLTDQSVGDIVLPKFLRNQIFLQDIPTFTLPDGETSKSLDGIAGIWEWLLQSGATRNDVMINLGGGMITDLGGFAASTYMRGIKCVNIPTTILGAVDAAIGGKTAANFNGYKNIVGTFHNPEAVVVILPLFESLPKSEILSGWGEMLKHSLLISTETLVRFLEADPFAPFDSPQWIDLIEESMRLKLSVVAEDFRESSHRKVLNLGHTMAHAIESVAMRKTKERIPHGYAVAWGIVTDLVLSRMLVSLDPNILNWVVAYIKELYPPFPFDCHSTDALIEAMTHDKKNRSAGELNFTLLKSPGEPIIDYSVDESTIRAAIDISRDFLS